MPQNFTAICEHFNPLTWDGDVPANHSENFSFSSTTCEYEITATSSVPTYNDWVFMGAVQVFFLALMAISFIFISFKK